MHENAQNHIKKCQKNAKNAEKCTKNDALLLLKLAFLLENVPKNRSWCSKNER
jgi:hypothetical protein